MHQNALANTGVLPAPGWHYEYGSATAFFVLPREGWATFLSAANSNTPIPPAVGSGGSSGRKATAAAPTGGIWSEAEQAATGGLSTEDVPQDENGVRDMRQVTALRSVSVERWILRPSCTDLVRSGL